MASSFDLPAPVIIKSDRLGRSRYSAQYKADVLAAFHKSAMSGTAFAKQCGVKYTTFASWIAKSRRDRGEQTTSSSTGTEQKFVLAEFSKAVSQPSSPRTTLEIQLPGGATATASNSAHVTLLAELLKALA